MLQDLRVRANAALGHVCDKNAPHPHSDDYNSHLRFFADVVTRLEARSDRARQLLEERSRGLLGHAFSRVFSHLRNTFPDFDFDADIDPIPRAIRGDLARWVEDNPPNIEAYVLPRLEMCFETFKEAKDFHNVYAKHAGFAIREGSKVETRVYLYCTCYGVYESKVSEANRQRNKMTARTNCGAKMRLKREKDGTVVTILEYVKYMQFKGIEHAQIMSILGGDDPGSYFLEMNTKDLINLKAKNSRMDDVDDVLLTVNFFREMKAINKELFCDMQHDESDRVKNIFWANTTFFGFTLIRDEDADSFRWLFKTFLRCMRGKAPTCILTDQCPAMALAIPDAFKNTIHKLCRWHIMKKYRQHLAYLYNLHEDFKDEFTSILNWPLMPTEFEAAWKGLMDTYHLHDDATMVAMWNEHERWISAQQRNSLHQNDIHTTK
ncbi:protein FAR1-RELATED SEQUENCE 5-like [Aegilops tauschii subsp. strangulata]|uniref:protein FAR1-RELATED SEQUENCE 5-like n=1 Tax=Aegilops tauschii subsp. strangulata TaxID=200361 RepID=UPI000989BBD8|nr:protein FAR1-RELATED SEQUENCE 5-like [Aegilops tauschii subsp. strangulata]